VTSKHTAQNMYSEKEFTREKMDQFATLSLFSSLNLSHLLMIWYLFWERIA